MHKASLLTVIEMKGETKPAAVGKGEAGREDGETVAE